MLRKDFKKKEGKCFIDYNAGNSEGRNINSIQSSDG